MPNGKRSKVTAIGKASRNKRSDKDGERESPLPATNNGAFDVILKRLDELQSKIVQLEARTSDTTSTDSNIPTEGTSELTGENMRSTVVGTDVDVRLSTVMRDERTNTGLGEATSTLRNVYVIQPVVTKPTFDGKAWANPIVFLKRLNKYINSLNAHDRGVDIALECVQGPARKVMELYSKGWTSLEDFEEDFRRNYWTEQIQEAVRYRLTSTVYSSGSGVTLSEHFAEQAGTMQCLTISFSERELVNAIMRHYPIDIQQLWFTSNQASNLINGANFLRSIEQNVVTTQRPSTMGNTVAFVRKDKYRSTHAPNTTRPTAAIVTARTWPYRANSGRGRGHHQGYRGRSTYSRVAPPAIKWTRGTTEEQVTGQGSTVGPSTPGEVANGKKKLIVATQQGPNCVATGSSTWDVNNSTRGLLNMAYRALVKYGWKAGEGLGARGDGRKWPVKETAHCGLNDRSSILTSIRTLLSNQFGNMEECEEGGTSCASCGERDKRVYTIFHELDGCEEGNTDYSLPKLPEIRVSLYGKIISALIDTGSQISGITRELYDTIQLEGGGLPEIPITAIQVQGAFGSRSESVNRLVLLELKLGGTCVETPMLVMRRLPRSLILGYDWLERVKGIVNCGVERTLTIEHQGIRTTIKLSSDLTVERLGGTENATLINTVWEQCARGSNKNKALIGLMIQTKGGKNKSDKDMVLERLEGMDLGREQKELLWPILKKHVKVFSDKLGLTDRYEHSITLKDETPFVKRSYPVPFAHREQIKETLGELEQLGVITQEPTPYCSPLTYTRKKDGSIRLLLDARELNKKMVGDAGAPPLTFEILQSFHGVNYISLIDLNNAYFQLPLRPDSRKYTGFSFMGKTYTYKVLPQGLKTSVAGFTRAMDTVLADVRGFCINYLDDIVVYTTGGGIREHIEHLDQVLDRLEAAKLTGRIEKCQFLCVEVKLLGHIVSTDGIRLDPDQVKAIKDFPVPRTIKQLRAFLGLLNYFRRFVAKYSEEVRPLCDLLKNNIKWAWTKEINQTFEQVKGLFLDSILLSHPDTRKTYYLQTDSSNLGISGYVYQLTDEMEERVIGFCSKSLTESERRWTVTEQELWAIIYSLRKFETYLRGAKLVIRTDHKSLIFLQSCKLLSSRMVRWVHYIGQFTYTVEYVKGKNNTVPDVLSRHIEGTTDVITTKSPGPEMNLFKVPLARVVQKEWKNIRVHQRNDALANRIFDRMGTLGTPEAKYFANKDGILYKVHPHTASLTLYVPENLQKDLIVSIHEEIGHFGRYKVYTLMKRRYYFANMSRVIGQVIRACEVCQKSKHALATHAGPVKAVLADDVGDKVYCDIYGPLPSGLFGMKYIFVMQDAFSKFIKLYPLRRATGKATLSCVRKFNDTIKIKTLVSDRGPNFTSKDFELGLKELGVELTHTSVRNPRPNSTERVNKELGRLFRTYCDKSHRSWVAIVPEIEDCYNQVPHTTTGYTPCEIMWGTETVLSTDKVLTNVNQPKGPSNHLEQIRLQSRQNQRSAAKEREIRYIKNHRLIRFEIGDLVKLKTFARSDADQKVTRKFMRLYEGPYIIGAVPYANVYTLIDEQTSEVRGNYNAIHLFRYYRA